MYADDTCVNIASENLNELLTDLKNELENVSNWMRINKLSLNASKSEYMVIGHRRQLRSMISEYRTRNHGDLQIPKVMLEYAKRSFYFSGVKNWNDIPDNIRERDLIARFRTGLRDYLLNLSQDPNTTPW